MSDHEVSNDSTESNGATEPAPPPPPPADPPSGESSNRTMMLVLSYLGILALIPFFAEKDDAEVQWHAKNGLVWAAAWLVIWVVLSAFSVMTGGFGCVFVPLMMLFPLVALGIHIVGMIKAINGDRFRLPFLSDFADKF